jgi:hypothetical protein
MKAAIVIVGLLLLLGGIALFLRRSSSGAVAGVDSSDALTDRQHLPPTPSGPTFSVGGALTTVVAVSSLGCQAVAMSKGVTAKAAKIGCDAWQYLTPVGSAKWAYDHAGAGIDAVKDAAGAVYDAVNFW